MPGIQDFLSLATSQLGVSEETTRSATGGLLSLIGDKVDAKDFQGLLGAMPGADALAQSGASSGGGGVMGMVSGLAGGLGGKLGTAAGLLGMLKSSGLSLDQAGSFVSLFADFARKNVDGAVLNRILDSVPDLKKALT